MIWKTILDIFAEHNFDLVDFASVFKDDNLFDVFTRDHASHLEYPFPHPGFRYFDDWEIQQVSKVFYKFAVQSNFIFMSFVQCRKAMTVKPQRRLVLSLRAVQY